MDLQGLLAGDSDDERTVESPRAQGDQDDSDTEQHKDVCARVGLVLTDDEIDEDVKYEPLQPETATDRLASPGIARALSSAQGNVAVPVPPSLPKVKSVPKDDRSPSTLPPRSTASSCVKPLPRTQAKCTEAQATQCNAEKKMEQVLREKAFLERQLQEVNVKYEQILQEQKVLKRRIKEVDEKYDRIRRDANRNQTRGALYSKRPESTNGKHCPPVPSSSLRPEWVGSTWSKEIKDAALNVIENVSPQVVQDFTMTRSYTPLSDPPATGGGKYTAAVVTSVEFKKHEKNGEKFIKVRLFNMSSLGVEETSISVTDFRGRRQYREGQLVLIREINENKVYYPKYLCGEMDVLPLGHCKIYARCGFPTNSGSKCRAPININDVKACRFHAGKLARQMEKPAARRPTATPTQMTQKPGGGAPSNRNSHATAARKIAPSRNYLGPTAQIGKREFREKEVPAMKSRRVVKNGQIETEMNFGGHVVNIVGRKQAALSNCGISREDSNRMRAELATKLGHDVATFGSMQRFSSKQEQLLRDGKDINSSSAALPTSLRIVGDDKKQFVKKPLLPKRDPNETRPAMRQDETLPKNRSLRQNDLMAHSKDDDLGDTIVIGQEKSKKRPPLEDSSNLQRGISAKSNDLLKDVLDSTASGHDEAKRERLQRLQAIETIKEYKSKTFSIEKVGWRCVQCGTRCEDRPTLCEEDGHTVKKFKGTFYFGKCDQCGKKSGSFGTLGHCRFCNGPLTRTAMGASNTALEAKDEVLNRQRAEGVWC
eukprot:Clim_evm73s149 gene=Clim_evmTU73s149